MLILLIACSLFILNVAYTYTFLHLVMWLQKASVSQTSSLSYMLINWISKSWIIIVIITIYPKQYNLHEPHCYSLLPGSFSQTTNNTNLLGKDTK